MYASAFFIPTPHPEKVLNHSYAAMFLDYGYGIYLTFPRPQFAYLRIVPYDAKSFPPMNGSDDDRTG